jgi:hypothetical protein
MDLGFTEEEEIWKRSLREFLEKEFAPMAEEKEKIGKPATREEAIEIAKKLKKIGLSPELENLGAIMSDMANFGIMMEEVGRVWASLGFVLGYSLTIPAVIQLLPDGMYLKERLLPKVKAGEVVATYALTETEAGTDNRAMKTTAVLDGDEYVINGSKTWATNGPISNLCLLVAKNEEGEQDLYFVDREESPYETSELGHMGLKYASTGELFFEDCRIPKENNLTDLMTEIVVGGDVAKLMDEFQIPADILSLIGTMSPVALVLGILRTGMTFLSVGISQACLEASIDYARERVQFGKPIGKFQLIQNMIYEIAVITETSRLLGYKTLDCLKRGDPDFRKNSSMAKGYACKRVVDAASHAIEIHGGNGLSDELPLERYFRDARMMTIPDGTTNINTLVVGRQILGSGFSAYV